MSWVNSFNALVGTRLRVTGPPPGNTVEVTVTDRGPSRRLYRRGRRLDLSNAAFRRLAPLADGVCRVRVEVEP